MRKFLFISASTATVAVMTPAVAQMYLPPAPGGYNAPGSTTPGYMWREQRANEDWRNNTWRERRLNEDWRNNNWRTQRANEDWRQRETYEKTITPNNATDRGYVGSAKPSDRTKTNPTETNNNPTDTNNNLINKGYLGER